MLIFLLAGLFLLAQVSPDTFDQEPQNEKDCLKSGGDWGGLEQGRGRIRGCNLPSKDAGKSCNSSDECDGICLQQDGGKGLCHTHKQYRGCGILVRDQKSNSIRVMCID